MKKPRICFVFLSIYPYLEGKIAGGAHRQLYLLGNELQKKFDVHFIAGDYGQPQIEHKDGFTLHRAYTPSPDSPAYMAPKQFLLLFRAMKQAEADVFIRRGGLKPAVASFTLARRLRTPFVYNVALDTDITNKYTKSGYVLKNMFYYMIQHADAKIAQTEKQAQIIDAKFDCDSFVVPNGYPDVDDKLPHEKRDYILWVGRLSRKQKRPHLYLELAKQFPNIDFLLAGPADHDIEYAKRIKQEAMKLKNIEFLGFVNPDEIHQYYRKSIAVINTSTYEGFPSTFLEAWRYNTPVLSLSVDTGRFANLSESPGFAQNDFDRLVRIVEKIQDNPKQRARLTQPYNDYFIRNYTIEQTSQRYADVLCEVIG